MPCFSNNSFLEFNEEVQCITRISIQKSILRFINNVAIFRNNSIGPLSINVGPSFPFHPLNFHFSHSSRIALQVQKLDSSTQIFVFGKMRKGMSKEEVETLT